MERDELKVRLRQEEITTKLINGRPGPDHYEIHWSRYGECTAEYVHGEAEATLYAEAHNVANRTGMWPREMQERIKELERALLLTPNPNGSGMMSNEFILRMAVKALFSEGHKSLAAELDAVQKSIADHSITTR